ncbi:MAG: archease [Thermodesulfobacteriota bacterium]
MDYEIINHTADVCIRFYGKSLVELFENVVCVQ